MCFKRIFIKQNIHQNNHETFFSNQKAIIFTKNVLEIKKTLFGKCKGFKQLLIKWFDGIFNLHLMLVLYNIFGGWACSRSPGVSVVSRLRGFGVRGGVRIGVGNSGPVRGVGCGRGVLGGYGVLGWWLLFACGGDGGDFYTEFMIIVDIKYRFTCGELNFHRSTLDCKKKKKKNTDKKFLWKIF